MLIDGALVNNGFYFNDFTTVCLYCLLLVDHVYLPPQIFVTINVCVINTLLEVAVSPEVEWLACREKANLFTPVFVKIHTLINKL